MVAGENVFLAHVEILDPAHLICYSYIFEGFVEESGSAVMLGLHDAVVDLILMDASLEEIDCKAGKLFKKLRTQDLLYVQEVISSVL